MFDVRRCEVWCESFTRWCDAQPDLVLYRGHCLLHRAELLQLHGRWAAGVAFAREACERLADPVNLLVIGGAHYVEAELHRLRGEFAEAEQAYERAHQAGCDPQPGLSLRGWPRVGSTPPPQGLAGCWPSPRGRSDGPRCSLRTPRSAGRGRCGGRQCCRARTGCDRAGLRFAAPPGAGRPADGRRPSGPGRFDRRTVSLRAALSGWNELDAPYDAARTRLVIAAACDAMGDGDGAAMERRAAQVTLDRLAAESGAAMNHTQNRP